MYSQQPPESRSSCCDMGQVANLVPPSRPVSYGDSQVQIILGFLAVEQPTRAPALAEWGHIWYRLRKHRLVGNRSGPPVSYGDPQVRIILGSIAVEQAIEVPSLGKWGHNWYQL